MEQSMRPGRIHTEDLKSFNKGAVTGGYGSPKGLYMSESVFHWEHSRLGGIPLSFFRMASRKIGSSTDSAMAKIR